MKIKVKYFDKSLPLLTTLKKGDWIDLYVRENVTLKSPQAGIQYQRDNQKFRDVKFDSCLLSLNVCMKIPKGYEAVVVPRSSTFKNYKILQTNHFGVIDNSFCGNTDEWKMPVLATEKTVIPAGTRICQFRIQLNQYATIWQKIKWLFWNGKIEFVVVDSLDSTSRGTSLTNNTTNKVESKND